MNGKETTITHFTMLKRTGIHQGNFSGETLSTALLHLTKRHGMHKLKAKYAALCLVARLSCMLQLVISVVH